MIWNRDNKIWYSKELIDKIKAFCVSAQDNTGAIIYKMIEEAER